MAYSGKASGINASFSLDNQSGTLKVLKSYSKSVTGLPGDKELGDVTVFGSSGYKYFPALQKADFSVECVYDDATDGAWDVMSDFQSDTQTRSFEYHPAGDSTGYPEILGECWITRLTLNAKTTEVLTFTADLKLDGALTVGVAT